MTACNEDSELISSDRVIKLKGISAQAWTRFFGHTISLSREEIKRYENAVPPPTLNQLQDDRPDCQTRCYNPGGIYNLPITGGTLTYEECKIINHHISLTLEMLEKLPCLRCLQNMPESSGTYHRERIDGTGYLCSLQRQQISIQIRIMAIANIFEVLTGADYSCKKPNTLSESIRIMVFMKKDLHIDADLFNLFPIAGIYNDYAKQYLRVKQIDDVDINLYLSRKAAERSFDE